MQNGEFIWSLWKKTNKYRPIFGGNYHVFNKNDNYLWILFKFIFGLFIFTLCMLVFFLHVCLCAMCMLVAEKVIRGNGIPLKFEWKMSVHHYMRAKNYTPVLCNSNKYYELLSHLSNPESCLLKHICSVLSCL